MKSACGGRFAMLGRIFKFGARTTNGTGMEQHQYTCHTDQSSTLKGVLMCTYKGLYLSVSVLSNVHSGIPFVCYHLNWRAFLVKLLEFGPGTAGPVKKCPGSLSLDRRLRIQL